MGMATPDGGAAEMGASVIAEHRPILRQRLMVTCPQVGLPVDTGFELSAVPNLRGSQVLFDCMECGQDHPWQIDDAFAD